VSAGAIECQHLRTKEKEIKIMDKEQTVANILEKVNELARVNTILLDALDAHEAEDKMELNIMVATAEKELIATIKMELE
jgi:hypothetical protein